MRLITTLGAIVVVSAFPTVENLARFVQRDEPLSIITDNAIEDLSRHLIRLKEKRLLFDPLTDPIDG
jgi:hypothetical protein